MPLGIIDKLNNSYRNVNFGSVLSKINMYIIGLPQNVKLATFLYD